MAEMRRTTDQRPLLVLPTARWTHDHDLRRALDRVPDHAETDAQTEET